MHSSYAVSRRQFLQSSALASAASLIPFPKASFWRSGSEQPLSRPLDEFAYGDVSLDSPLHEQQLQETQAVLMEPSEDSLLKPFREMVGQPAPGEDLGGWYQYEPDYDWHTFDTGFAPAGTFGQWVSALARGYAISGSQAVREKVLRLNRLYAQTIDGKFYERNRFPAYCYDKLVCGLIDSHQFVGDPDAFAILAKTTDAALPHLPGQAVEHGTSWRPAKDVSWTWDESYTMPENLFLAYRRGAGERYRKIAEQYLMDSFFDRLAAGQNDFAGRHAYSHVNCLSSAMQAYLTLGSEKHLQAAKNGFDILLAQSFATGGWGPDETLRVTGSPDVFESLTKTHSSFETPCGSYAHFKLTRYLLQVTGDPRYGDSMERMMYNTVLGAKPLEPDGRTFYYSDYNFSGQKVYSPHRWPCCSGTLPQVAADYRINTYFRDRRGLYVNLYIPSTVRWTHHDRRISLTQRGDYPNGELVQFELKTSKAVAFAVSLRIPAWAEKASVGVNDGKPREVQAGSFARIEREWKDGDQIVLELAMTPRLEPVEAKHTDTVALMVAPLVLFMVGESQPAVNRPQLLAAQKMTQGLWHVPTPNSPMKMVTWTTLGDQPYTTYLRVT
jgi:DUF1680 family protein